MIMEPLLGTVKQSFEASLDSLKRWSFLLLLLSGLQVSGQEPSAERRNDSANYFPAFSGEESPFFIECGRLESKDRKKCTQELIKVKVAELYKLPDINRDVSWTGTVYVEFFIDELGLVGQVKVVKSSGIKAVDSAGVEAVKELQDFVPAFRNGIPVRFRYVIPIKIRLPAEYLEEKVAPAQPRRKPRIQDLD